MRIRKRFLSLSAAITAAPSSDLESGEQHRHQLVQHQEVHPNVNPHVVVYDNSQSQFSNPPNHCYHPIPAQIGLQSSTWISSGAGGSHDPNKTYKELESERKKEIVTTADDTGCRKESILCTDEANSHDLVLKEAGWFEEGDSRLIPIKKRRSGSCFEKRMKVQCHDHSTNIKEKEEEDDHINNEMMMIEGTLVKSSKARKSDYNYEAAAARAASSPIIKKKKKKGGSSRCSRVNGRGWRCSQQTLVGYSLCDHHLGKGRLSSRTTTSHGHVRGRKLAQNNDNIAALIEKPQETTTTTTKESQLAGDQGTNESEEEDEELELKDWDDDEVESIMSSSTREIIISKRTKLGAVKARSLSSLLSQIGSSSS